MGIVYIATNEAFDGMVKIGKVIKLGKTIEERIGELYTTNVPMPYECVYAIEVGEKVIRVGVRYEE